MLDTRTRLLGVIGHPVTHSLGPVMHNAALQAMNYPAVYLAFDVTDPAGAMTGMRALGITGLSVTIPHKVAVMDYLDEVDPLAARIGAVNTIVNRDGLLSGYNTDCQGAVTALKAKIDPAGKRIAILGAGGAARAVGFGLKEAGARVVLYNRGPERGRALAAALEAEFHPWSDLADVKADVIVNTTSVGMTPQAQYSPLPEHVLTRDMLVMDIVYTPLRTRLLQTAAARGCATIDGLAMFILQGARQLALWTGSQPPVDIMRAAVQARLEKPCP